MTITIEKNYTRYNTEDLEKLLNAAQGAEVPLYERDWRSGTQTKKKSQATFDQGWYEAHPLSGARPRSGGWNVAEPGDPVYICGDKIRIRGEKALLSGRWGNYSKEDFSGGEAPDALIEEVVFCLIRDGMEWAYRSSLRLAPAYTQLAVRLVAQKLIAENDLRLRLLDAAPDKESIGPRKKSTKADKAARLYEFYGYPTEDDRELKGSGTTGAYQWDGRLSSSEKYYTREWERREKHRKKLIALGEDPVPYEHFGEYLRRKAKEWENKNALLVLSRLEYGDEED